MILVYYIQKKPKLVDNVFHMGTCADSCGRQNYPRLASWSFIPSGKIRWGSPTVSLNHGHARMQAQGHIVGRQQKKKRENEKEIEGRHASEVQNVSEYLLKKIARIFYLNVADQLICTA